MWLVDVVVDRQDKKAGVRAAVGYAVFFFVVVWSEASSSPNEELCT